MPDDPPAELKELGIVVDKYTSIAKQGTEMVKWRVSETVVFWVLGLFCLPWARSWHKKCRLKHYAAFESYVQVSGYNDLQLHGRSRIVASISLQLPLGHVAAE